MVAVMFSRNRASQLRGIDEWGLVGAAKPSHTSDHYMALLLLLRSNMATERLSCEPDGSIRGYGGAKRSSPL